MAQNAQPLLASEVARQSDGALSGSDCMLLGVCSLGNPKAGHLTFARDAAASGLAVERALHAGAVVLVDSSLAGPATGTTIVVTRPRDAFAIAFRRMYAHTHVAGIASTAVIDPTAVVPTTSRIGDFAYIGPGVTLGEYCVVKAGACLGEPGLAIAKDEAGNNVAMPHIGGVVIGDWAEIGALSTISSGTIDPTTIAAFTKIDDHVHIAHNCQVGSNTIVTAGATVAGSVTIGEGAWLGPNCAITDGVTIGDGAFIGIGAVVLQDCKPHGVYSGNPARKYSDTKPG